MDEHSGYMPYGIRRGQSVDGRHEYQAIDHVALCNHLRSIPEAEREAWIGPFLWFADHEPEIRATAAGMVGSSLSKWRYDDGLDRGVIVAFQMFIPHSSVPHRN